MSLSDKVLETIEKEHVHPKPRWRFVVHNVLVWGSGFFFLIVGAISVSLIIFSLSNAGWGLREFVGNTMFDHLLTFFPTLWLMAFLVFILICELVFRQTKKGYRYTLGTIVVVIFVSSALLGAIMYTFGISHFIDEAVAAKVMGYESHDERRQKVFHIPEHGRLSGVVTKLTTNDMELYNQYFGEEWNVQTVNVPSQSRELLGERRLVLVFGEQSTDQNFVACEVRVIPEWGIVTKRRNITLHNQATGKKLDIIQQRRELQLKKPGLRIQADQEFGSPCEKKRAKEEALRILKSKPKKVSMK